MKDYIRALRAYADAQAATNAVPSFDWAALEAAKAAEAQALAALKAAEAAMGEQS